MSVGKLIQAIPELCLSILGQLKPRLLVTQRDIVIIERKNDCIAAIGKHKPHLAVFLGYDRHGYKVVDIDKGRAQKIVSRMKQNGSVNIFDAILAVVFEHLMELHIFLFHALLVETHGLLIGNHFEEIVV